MNAIRLELNVGSCASVRGAKIALMIKYPYNELFMLYIIVTFNSLHIYVLFEFKIVIVA